VIYEWILAFDAPLLKRRSEPKPVDTSITRVSRQVHCEARAVFYNLNTIKHPGTISFPCIKSLKEKAADDVRYYLMLLEQGKSVAHSLFNR